MLWNNNGMRTVSEASPALAVLLYSSPISAGAVFLTLKTVAACLLHESSERSSLRRRRFPLLAVQILSFATVAAEWLSIAAETRRRPERWPSEPYVASLVLESLLQASLSCGLLDNPKPVYYPYQGAWLTGVLLGIPSIALQAKVSSAWDDHVKFRVSMQALRVAILLSLFLVTGCLALHDRNRSIKLDVESEALLAANGNGHVHIENGHAGGPTPYGASEQGGEQGSDFENSRIDRDNDRDQNDDDDATIDDDEDHEERARRKAKTEQAQRMKEAGNIWNYVKSFKIFVPLVIPIKNRRAQFSLVIIFLVVIGQRVLNILIPRQMGFLVDDLTKMAGTGITPWRTLGFWVFYYWLNSATGLGLIKNEAELILEQFAYKEILTVSFRHIMGLSMDFHSSKNSGELIQAMSQAESMTSIFQYILFEVAPVVFDIFVAIAVISKLFDMYMALVMFVSGSVYFWLGLRLTRWTVDSRRAYVSASRQESRISNEAINNWTTVSHFNRADYEAKRYNEKVDLANQKQWWYYQTFYIGGGVQNFVMLTGRVLGTMLAAYRVSQGQASVGDFFFLQSYWSRMEYPLDTLQYSVRKVSSMLVDAERLREVLTTLPSVRSSPDAPSVVIEKGKVDFDHVEFAYDQRKPTLRDITFTASPGQTIALVGETGGGKSTILKLLYRYYDVTKGAIRIDGQDLREVNLDSLRDSFGMVPQDPSLFNVSVMENIKYARLDATDEEVKEACKAACIHDKILSFPDKYKSVVGERGMKLSGGEMQRIAIARAMLRKPKIIVLDEATSQIDADTESQIQIALERLTKGRTTFIIAHRLSTIQHADQILVINDGEIVQSGTHSQLFHKPGKYKDLWSKQLSKDSTIFLSDESPAAVTSEETAAKMEDEVASVDHVEDPAQSSRPATP